MNVTANSAASSLYRLLSMQQPSTSRSSHADSTGSTIDTGSTSFDASSVTGGNRPPPPPGPPPGEGSSGSGNSSNSSSFNLAAMSTSQFASMGGSPPGGDPFSQLDSDQDGSVSSDEIGLSSATDEVKKLFSAIDGNSDGALSGDEISSFKDSLAQQQGSQGAHGAQGGHRPDGPPPGPPPDRSDDESSASSGNSSSDSTSTSSVQAAARKDVAAMLQRLAEQYLTQTGSAAAGQTSSSLSVSA